MLRKSFALRYLLLAVVVTSLIACATFDKNAFTTLSIAKTSYNAIMSSLSDLQKQGKISQVDVNKIYPYTVAYYNAYLVAESAYEVYHKNPTVQSQNQLTNLLIDASKKLAELAPLLQPFNIKVEPLNVPTK